LNRVDPEGVIRWFESRPLPQHSPAALAEYVKALVKVDRLGESALLKTLQRGACIIAFLFLHMCTCTLQLC
jgi:ATP-dependent metalloprotease